MNRRNRRSIPRSACFLTANAGYEMHFLKCWSIRYTVFPWHHKAIKPHRIFRNRRIYGYPSRSRRLSKAAEKLVFYLACKLAGEPRVLSAAFQPSLGGTGFSSPYANPPLRGGLLSSVRRRRTTPAASLLGPSHPVHVPSKAAAQDGKFANVSVSGRLSTPAAACGGPPRTKRLFLGRSESGYTSSCASLMASARFSAACSAIPCQNLFLYLLMWPNTGRTGLLSSVRRRRTTGASLLVPLLSTLLPPSSRRIQRTGWLRFTRIENSVLMFHSQTQ